MANPLAQSFYPMFRLCGLNIRDGRRIHMALKAYYDGSTDGQAIVAVTLSGVAATEKVWEKFEPAWLEVLRKYLVKDNIMHMAALMGFHNDFSPENGWDETQRNKLLGDLFNVWGSFDETVDLEARSCTVILKDWERANKQVRHLPEPEAICVNFCVGGLRLPLVCANEPKPIMLYFDQSEPFMHKINRVWQPRNKSVHSLFNQIRTIENATREYFPIQAADINAWIVNHSDMGMHDAFLETSMEIAVRYHHRKRYDYDAIMEDYPPPLGWLKPNPQ
jgi:hypothetical protein